tara:strand:- start:15442 stop:15753 length:312 start_codon:yes stop_codon:yes gene_type:complete
MTVKEYIDKLEDQMNRSISEELKEYIPEILRTIQSRVVERFIDDGDPVLSLGEFKEIFDRVVSEGINEKIDNNNSLTITNGVFVEFFIKDDKGVINNYEYCLN